MPLRWPGFGKAKNDAEAGSSSGRRLRLRTPSPTPPSSPEPKAPAAFELAPPGAQIARRDRVYVRREDCEWYWEHACPLPWPDVKLCEGWHLNPQRIPVPPMPTSQRARDLVVDRRRRLPASLRADPAYAASSPNWDTWFSGEHSLRRQACYTRAPTPPPASRWDLPPHMRRRDAPPVPRSTARSLRIGSPPPPPPVKMEVEDELAAALEASKHTIVEDEEKRWVKILEAVAREKEEALQAQQAAVLEEPQQWWQVPMDVDLPPVPPLPAGLLGQSWTFNGGSWTTPLPEQDAEQPPTPPAAVPQRQGIPAHLYQEPPYYILDDDED